MPTHQHIVTYNLLEKLSNVNSKPTVYYGWPYNESVAKSLCHTLWIVNKLAHLRDLLHVLLINLYWAIRWCDGAGLTSSAGASY